jgi:hypothetical protein
MLPTTLTACANDAAQQLAEPDSPTPSDLWYTNRNAFDVSVLQGFGLVG